ncbi:23S rRNA (guanosine(2251)-2'-O)-methyltransferase RlmB [uncultured Pseudokineococcus sp.]|uniref:23S rRNA (guanosine(2251)-2'-O)-methyltransferase RlmB n=1 Tax=uncultured Pseudokineococcus sp. TaxID=1642928 RepID=UPI00261C1B52|nr:23S rRNA (guanosine(2251)-2'-O)-methyltransferase RlmB [uncultured Pseudokineococcus sp.]
MAGNSQRRGAVRRAGSKKGAVVGSGGKGRRALEGKGPTPKAEDRPYHVAHKRAQTSGAGRSGPQGGRAAGQRRRGAAGSTEVVAGRNSVVEALRADIPATALYVAARVESDDRTREAIKTAADRGVPLLEASRTDLDRLTDGAVHQGLALQVPPYQYADVEDLLEAAARTGRPPLLVALDGVTDPRNLGAVLRSVAAFGGHGVVVPERRSAGVTASAWKTSAGAAARVPVARAGNLTRALQQLKSAGLFVVGLDAGGDVQLPELELATGPVVLVVGSEGKGLGRLVRESCDQVVSIPMESSTESLNAGIAAGVALYEVARRRG